MARQSEAVETEVTMMVKTSTCLIKGDTITAKVDCGDTFSDGSRDDSASFTLSFGKQRDDEQSFYETASVSLVMCDAHTVKNVLSALTEVTDKFNEWLMELEKERV
jgi:hypothetical protein